MTDLADRVPDDAPGAVEIGFSIPQRYNASEILFRNRAAGRGGRVAVYGAAGNATYADLCMRAERVGNALLSLGLRRGDRVLLLLNDTAEYPACFFGAVRAGLVPVLLNTLLNRDLLRFHIEDAASRVAIADAEYAPLFDAATVAGTTLETLVVMGEPPSGLGCAVRRGCTWFSGFPARLAAADTSRDDMAFWMYSSGTSGRPKGIVHLQHDMEYTARAWPRHVLGMTADDICFSVPKCFFAYGFGNSITFPFAVGASAVLHPGRPEPGVVWDCIRRFRPTLFFGLPTLYTALLHHADAPDSLPSLRLCLSAAEVLSPELFAAWRDRFGLEIVEGMGSTEVLHIYVSNTPEVKRLGRAGRRVPGYELRLTTPEGDPAPQGEPGLLWVRGHSSAPCYWNRPDKTVETMREGWIRTGDRMSVDADGFYLFHGRADELIKVSGQWVHPLEIEVCLAGHPAVRECAVLGVELPDRRMTTQAFVVLKDGVPRGGAPRGGAAGNGRAGDAAVAADMQAWVKARLLPHKYPRVVTFVDDLPKTGTNKIDRQALRRGVATGGADAARDGDAGGPESG